MTKKDNYKLIHTDIELGINVYFDSNYNGYRLRLEELNDNFAYADLPTKEWYRKYLVPNSDGRAFTLKGLIEIFNYLRYNGHTLALDTEMWLSVIKKKGVSK